MGSERETSEDVVTRTRCFACGEFETPGDVWGMILVDGSHRHILAESFHPACVREQFDQVIEWLASQEIGKG